MENRGIFLAVKYNENLMKHIARDQLAMYFDAGLN